MKNKKGNLKKIIYNSNLLKFGSIGLKTLNSGFITRKQKICIENFIIKNKIKVWYNLPPFYSITKKGNSIRMGKGPGKMIEKISKISKGKIILEFCYSNFNFLIIVIKKIQKKLSIKTKLVR